MNRLLQRCALPLALCFAAPASLRAQPAAEPSEPAPADAPSSDDLASARVDLEAGDAHYEAGRYDDAIGAYQRGYQKSKKPGFLYNIAQAQRLAGYCADAVASYEAFLAADPETVTRAQVEQHLRELEACAAEERAAETSSTEASASAAEPPALAPGAPPAQTTEPVAAMTASSSPGDARRGTSLRWVGVGVTAAGVLGLGTSAYFMHRGGSLEDELSGCSREAPCDAQTYEDGQAANRNAWISGIGGGVLVAGGVALILLDLAGGDASGDAALSVAPSAGGASLVYGGRF